MKLGYELKIAVFITEIEFRLWGEPSAAFQDLERVTGKMERECLQGPGGTGKGEWLQPDREQV